MNKYILSNIGVNAIRFLNDFDPNGNTDAFGFLDKIQGGIESLYAVVKEIAPWVAIIFAGIQCAKLIIANDDQSVGKAKRALLWTAVGFISIYFVPDIVIAIASAFGAN